MSAVTKTCHFGWFQVCVRRQWRNRKEDGGSGDRPWTNGSSFLIAGLSNNFQHGFVWLLTGNYSALASMLC